MNASEIAQNRRAQPFLKWVGGKRQLLGELTRTVDRSAPFARYHEPFVGGGALFFALHASGRLDDGQVFLSDANARLIETYQAVRSDPDGVIAALEAHAERHSPEHYYAVRANVPRTPTGRAARVIYLNRTCFNGLYRENSRGEFNVPMGRYANPRICDAPNLHAVALALRDVELECRPFESVLDRAEAGDLVYFDPPYVPLSKTASFTAYDAAGFGPDDQNRLAAVFAELDRRGVKVMLSNSMAPLVRKLYKPFRIVTVQANRAVNSRTDRRGKIAEALVSNF